MRPHPFALAGFVGAAALAMTSPAWAHAHLVSSTPSANAVVAASPAAITLTFNSKIVPAFSSFEVTMPAHGGMKTPVKTVVSKDGKSLVGTPQARLAKGAYKIVYKVASADGHKMSGEVLFKVG